MKPELKVESADADVRGLLDGGLRPVQSSSEAPSLTVGGKVLKLIPDQSGGVNPVI